MGHIHELYDFTTSAFIMHPNEPKILLLHHKKLNSWLQPGGHVELDENPLQALHHEIEEETGLKPDDYDILEPADHPNPTGNNTVLPLPFYFNEHHFTAQSKHRHIDICYLVKAKTTTLTEKPDGASDIGWFTRTQIKDRYNNKLMFKDTYQICEWIFKNKC